MLPRNLSWPGMRECDVSDDRRRRSLYGMLLAQGQRNDIARFVNGGLLRQDWPLIKATLEGRVSRGCERRFGLGERNREQTELQASGTSGAPG